MNCSIINEVERKSLKKEIEQTKKEIVINMYNDKYSLELISKYTKLTIDEIKNIIDKK